MNTGLQSVNLTSEIITQETLQSTIASQGSLQAKVSTQKILKAMVAPQSTLKGTVNAQKNLKGNMSKAAYTVDSELSEESENPVQNKIVAAALGKKIEILNIAKNTDIDKLFK